MCSEIYRENAVPAVAPLFFRVVHGGLAHEPEGPSIAQQLEQSFLEGKQRGFADALAAARKEADAKLEAVLQRVAQAMVELAEARQRVREETAADLVRLAISIASRILHREITLDPDAIHGLLKAAFEKTQSREVTRILVHPAYEATVRRFVEQMASPSAIEITSDPRLEHGAIRIETTLGELDASI